MCKFCEAMKTNGQIAVFLQRYDPERSKYSYSFSVAIVTRTFVKGSRGCRATDTDYRYRGCGYELNYCPECGRKMEKKEVRM